MNDNLIFAFDVGKASLGICARTDTHILELKSLNIPAEFAATADFRARRHAERTRLAHKKREDWLLQKWQEAGLIEHGPEHWLEKEPDCSCKPQGISAGTIFVFPHDD